MPGFSGCTKRVLLVEPLPHHRAPGDEVAGGIVRHVAKIRLRLDDGVEIAAIGDVDRDLAELRALDRQPFGIQEGRHIGDAHLLDVVAVLPVLGDHQPGRRVEPRARPASSA